MSERSPKESAFPHWVALGSLVFVLVLFFTNTVPALRERQGLTDLSARLSNLQQQFESAIDHTYRQARLGNANLSGQEPDGNFDLQSLLVAIDEHNLTPLELWQQYGGSLEEGEDRKPR